MEKLFNDLTLGYAETVDFAKLCNHGGNHVPSFRRMATPDGTSYVIVYTWVDGIAKTFNDMEEAFYIDGINEENRERATEIFQEVFDLLMVAFAHCPNQLLMMEPLVEEVVQKHSQGRH